MSACSATCSCAASCCGRCSRCGRCDLVSGGDACHRCKVSVELAPRLPLLSPLRSRSSAAAVTRHHTRPMGAPVVSQESLRHHLRRRGMQCCQRRVRSSAMRGRFTHSIAGTVETTQLVSNAALERVDCPTHCAAVVFRSMTRSQRPIPAARASSGHTQRHILQAATTRATPHAVRTTCSAGADVLPAASRVPRETACASWPTAP